MYVLYIKTYMQDGTQECTAIFNSIEDALTYIQERANWVGDRETFQLFSLGAEIPLVIYDDIEVKTTHHKVKRVKIIEQQSQRK